VRVCVRVCARACIRARARVCVCGHGGAAGSLHCAGVCECVCVCVHVHVCVCVCGCVWVGGGYHTHLQKGDRGRLHAYKELKQAPQGRPDTRTAVQTHTSIAARPARGTQAAGPAWAPATTTRPARAQRQREASQTATPGWGREERAGEGGGGQQQAQHSTTQAHKRGVRAHVAGKGLGKEQRV
jgi:hypothetical protein